MFIVMIVLILLGVGLLNVLSEKGEEFYKDNRFWMTLSGIILMAIASLVIV